MFRNISTNWLRYIDRNLWAYADFKTTFPCFPKEANEDDTYLVTPTIEQIENPLFKPLLEYYKDWIVWQSPVCHNLAHRSERRPRIYLYVLEKPKKV